MLEIYIIYWKNLRQEAVAQQLPDDNWNGEMYFRDAGETRQVNN